MARQLGIDRQPQGLERVPTGKSAVERVRPPRWLIRHLVNPIAKRLVERSTGRIGSELLVLRFVGRKSSRRYAIPVGYRSIKGRLALLTNSGWRHNFKGGAPVEFTLRGKSRNGRATLMDDPYEVAKVYASLIDEVGLDNSRRLGIRINVAGKPTVDDLAVMVARTGLSIVWLDLPESRADLQLAGGETGIVPPWLPTTFAKCGAM